MSPLCNSPPLSFPPTPLQFPPQYPTVQVMTAVTDCDSSCPLSCNSPHPASSSSHKSMFLSPGHPHPLVPTVSPVSPLHIENVLVAPILASLIPSPSHMLDSVGPASPRQPSPCPALPQGHKSEIPHSQPAFVPALPAHPLHTYTGQSQSTHLPSNGSSQPLMKVIIMAAMQCKCLPRGREGNPFNVTISVLETLFSWQIIKSGKSTGDRLKAKYSDFFPLCKIRMED